MATTVGLVHLKFHVAQASSLKDKRRALKSFKDRLKNTFNVSIAEVDGADNRRWAVVAVAMTGSDKRHVEGALQRVINAAERDRNMILVDREIAWL